MLPKTHFRLGYSKKLNVAGSAFIAICGAVAALHADVKLPSIISDNMVLQAGKPIVIWGTADPGEEVSVEFAAQKETSADNSAGWNVNLSPSNVHLSGTYHESHGASSSSKQGMTFKVTDSQGRWHTTFSPQEAGTTGTLTVKGKNELTVHNILIGSVWICSGQSNMEMGVKMCHNASTELPKANYPKIRLFAVKKTSELEPQTDFEGHWTECTPESLAAQGSWGGFSAVAYFFGRDIHIATGMPVGLIQTCWGGTPAQSWTSLSGLKKAPVFTDYVAQYEDLVKNLPARLEKYAKDKAEAETKYKAWEETIGNQYQADLQKWEQEAKEARTQGKPEPAKPTLAVPAPKRPSSPEHNSWTPSSLYNAMIAPLIPSYAIEGVIWYQGEANAHNSVEYRTLFPRMISDWREKWRQGDFPFLFVQLASYIPSPTTPDKNWQWQREAQTAALKLPNTAMAVTIDIGEPHDIHPKDKMDVGHRLALAAEKLVYGKDVVYSGPVYGSMKIDGTKVRLSFKNTGSGLVIETAPAIRVDAPPQQAATGLKGFMIAGADKRFVSAEAKIEGNEVVVSNDSVTQPAAVRYGWQDFPEVNLYNKEGLPAAPFRTDDWAMDAP